ncbi:MAG: FAD-dependent oxidoreductase [Pseudonocardiaceae bacterium]
MILVVGGGIAGAAVALALHKAGIDVAVHEAHPESSGDEGAFLTLAENGMRALRQIDAAGVVAQASAPLRAMRVCGGDGTEIAAAALGDGQGPGYRYLTRARLCMVLQREVRRRGIVLRRGERLVAAGPEGRGVVASFANGIQTSADLLIGADGVRSTVRGVLDPHGAAPRYVGQRVFYGYAVDTGVSGDPDCIHFVRGGAAFGYLVTEREGTWWFARVSDEELACDRIDAGTTVGWVAELEALLRNEPVPLAIVRSARRVLVTNAYDLAGVRIWHRGRMVIIGDAAHAASPATGQGASMALEDAVVLAKALRDMPDPESAFAVYERLRRDRVEANTAASAGMSASPTPADARSSARQSADIEEQLDWNTPATESGRGRRSAG